MNTDTGNYMEDILKIPDISLLEECISLLDEGHAVLLTAKGSSMLPFIRDGEKILLQKAGTYRRGDIVLARTDDGKTVLHRIVSKEGGKGGIVTLMGDHNLRKREICPEDGIKGKVESVTGKKGTRPTSSWKFRVLSSVWIALLPFRRALVRITDLMYK